jgi:hypothetical protein
MQDINHHNHFAAAVGGGVLYCFLKSVTVPLLPLYTLMTWTGKILPLPLPLPSVVILYSARSAPPRYAGRFVFQPHNLFVTVSTAMTNMERCR